MSTPVPQQLSQWSWLTCVLGLSSGADDVIAEADAAATASVPASPALDDRPAKSSELTEGEAGSPPVSEPVEKRSLALLPASDARARRLREPPLPLALSLSSSRPPSASADAGDAALLADEPEMMSRSARRSGAMLSSAVPTSPLPVPSAIAASTLRRSSALACSALNLMRRTMLAVDVGWLGSVFSKYGAICTISLALNCGSSRYDISARSVRSILSRLTLLAVIVLPADGGVATAVGENIAGGLAGAALRRRRPRIAGAAAAASFSTSERGRLLGSAAAASSLSGTSSTARADEGSLLLPALTGKHSIAKRSTPVGDVSSLGAAAGGDEVVADTMTCTALRRRRGGAVPSGSSRRRRGLGAAAVASGRFARAAGARRRRGDAR
eukprot:Unigene9903_Nuclearia_a/m.30239 Unigene9903_Nuclearia_a/g.30239  ORF Unigene9903_Nuclearia_a/g.30239 Unigene9903_Nuclearia_a/m.30239 type:complete len:385 (+) Unigene9903_Nuclearia_a:1160-2314(+)